MKNFFEKRANCIIILLAVIIFVGGIYWYRDFRYSQLQGQYQTLAVSADNVAKNLSECGKLFASIPQLKDNATVINQVLAVNGFAKYQVAIPAPTPQEAGK